MGCERKGTLWAFPDWLLSTVASTSAMSAMNFLRGILRSPWKFLVSTVVVGDKDRDAEFRAGGGQQEARQRKKWERMSWEMTYIIFWVAVDVFCEDTHWVARGSGVAPERIWARACLRHWPVSSRPSRSREASGPGVGLSGGGGCDRCALVLPPGGGGGPHVAVSPAESAADDPEIVSTGYTGWVDTS